MRYPDLFQIGIFLLFLELLVSLSRGILTSDDGDGKDDEDDEMFNFFWTRICSLGIELQVESSSKFDKLSELK